MFKASALESAVKGIFERTWSKIKAEHRRKEKKKKNAKQEGHFSENQLLQSGLNEFEGKRTTLELLELAGKKAELIKWMKKS